MVSIVLKTKNDNLKIRAPFFKNFKPFERHQIAITALFMIVRNHTSCIHLHFTIFRFCSSVCTLQINKLIVQINSQNES